MNQDHVGASNMRALSTLALCLIATNWLCGGEPGKGAEQSREAQRRAAERQVRASLAKGYAEARIKAQAQYLNDLAGACHWLAGAQAQAEAQKVIGDIEKVDPKFGRLPDLRKAVAGIAAPAALDDAKKKELATRIKNAAQSRVKGFLELASTCYRAGLLGLAYDLVWDIFDIDPDNGFLYVHWNDVKATDIETATKMIVGNFEKILSKIFY
ncbi:MAG: hypothetical protein ABSE73_04405 [Planctomycetota bacterium]